MPPRKAPEQRVGHASTAANDPRFVSVSRARSRHREVIVPEPDPKWLPKARSWYNSLKVSGQTDLWQASDWTTAVAAADMYDRFLRTNNASILHDFLKCVELLGATEISRKRARIELVDEATRDADEEAADAAILGWHGRLRSVE